MNKLMKWLRREPVTITKIEYQDRVEYIVDPHMGKRQLDTIWSRINRKPYNVGDSIESVAYRQGQIDLFEFISKQILGGKA